MRQQLTKRLLESALEGESTDHLGYDKHEPASLGTGNSRNGTRPETVLTDVGPVEIDVPSDRDASFEPKIVSKWQKTSGQGGQMAISLDSKASRPERSRRIWLKSMALRCLGRRSP